MSVIMTQKLSFFPTTHAKFVVCFPTIIEGEQGPKGLMEEIQKRYYKAYQAWRDNAASVAIGDVFAYSVDNDQIVVFLPLKNDYRDGQINDNIIRAVTKLKEFLNQHIETHPGQAHQVTMPPILLEQLEGETRRQTTLRSFNWMRRKLEHVRTTIEVSASPWRMMRKPDDVPLFYLGGAGYYDWVSDTAKRALVPENIHGSMERNFITCDTDWNCDTTLADLGIERSELQFYYEYTTNDTVFVLSLCQNKGDITPDGEPIVFSPSTQ